MSGADGGRDDEDRGPDGAGADPFGFEPDERDRAAADDAPVHPDDPLAPVPRGPRPPNGPGRRGRKGGRPSSGPPRGRPAEDDEPEGREDAAPRDAAPAPTPKVRSRVREGDLVPPTRRMRMGARMGTASSAIGGGRYVALSVLVFVLIALIVFVNLGSSKDTRQLVAGQSLPQFAAPLALGGVDEAVDITQDEAAPGRGACRPEQARNPRALTSCALVRGGPSVILTFQLGDTRCIQTVDRFDRMLRTRPDVRGVALAIAGTPKKVAPVVRDRGWRVRVIDDVDGRLVSTLIGTPVCPVAVLVGSDGKIFDPKVVVTGDGANLAAAIDRMRRQERTDATRRGATLDRAPGTTTSSAPTPPARGGR